MRPFHALNVNVPANGQLDHTGRVMIILGASSAGNNDILQGKMYIILPNDDISRNEKVYSDARKLYLSFAANTWQ